MLVLSRYRDESIYIGDDVIVTVIDVRGDRVRLGIQAPPHISVHRQEIYDAIRREHGSVTSAAESPAETAVETKKSAPLAQKLAESKRQGLPVDLDSPLEFGGFTDIIPR